MASWRIVRFRSFHVGFRPKRHKFDFLMFEFSSYHRTNFYRPHPPLRGLAIGYERIFSLVDIQVLVQQKTSYLKHCLNP